MQASRNTHWRLDRALRRAHLHHRRVTSAKAAALRPESLLRDSTTTRSSRSVGAERGAPSFPSGAESSQELCRIPHLLLPLKTI